MDMEFRELLFTKPDEVSLLRNAAANFADNEDEALMMCRIYLPQMSMEKTRLFLQWLARQPDPRSGPMKGLGKR